MYVYDGGSDTLALWLGRGREICLMLALTIAWFLRAPFLRSPRSPRVLVEMGKALVVASFPALLLGVAATWIAENALDLDLDDFEVLGVQPTPVSFRLAIASAAFLPLTLLVLYARSRRTPGTEATSSGSVEFGSQPEVVPGSEGDLGQGSPQ